MIIILTWWPASGSHKRHPRWCLLCTNVCY